MNLARVGSRGKQGWRADGQVGLNAYAWVRGTKLRTLIHMPTPSLGGRDDDEWQ